MQLLIHLQHRFSLSRLPTPLMWSWARGELLGSLLPRMGAEFSPPTGSPPALLQQSCGNLLGREISSEHQMALSDFQPS